MQAPPQRRLFLKALIVSILLNGLMILLSMFSGTSGVRSLMVRIGDAIAAPPGVIARWAFQPREHSVGAFVTAAGESLVFSILFYAAAALLLLEAANRIVRKSPSLERPNPESQRKA